MNLVVSFVGSEYAGYNQVMSIVGKHQPVHIGGVMDADELDALDNYLDSCDFESGYVVIRESTSHVAPGVKDILNKHGLTTYVSLGI